MAPHDPTTTTDDQIDPAAAKDLARALAAGPRPTDEHVDAPVLLDQVRDVERFHAEGAPVRPVPAALYRPADDGIRGPYPRLVTRYGPEDGLPGTLAALGPVDRIRAAARDKGKQLAAEAVDAGAAVAADVERDLRAKLPSRRAVVSAIVSILASVGAVLADRIFAAVGKVGKRGKREKHKAGADAGPTS